MSCHNNNKIVRLIRTPSGSYINPETTERIYDIDLNGHDEWMIRTPSILIKGQELNITDRKNRKLFQTWLDEMCAKNYEVILT